MSEKINISQKYIGNRFFSIRDVQVMFDSDLAEIYEVETRVLNNPLPFLTSQNVTLKDN